MARSNVSLGKDTACTRPIERFEDIVAYPILGGLRPANQLSRAGSGSERERRIDQRRRAPAVAAALVAMPNREMVSLGDNRPSAPGCENRISHGGAPRQTFLPPHFYEQGLFHPSAPIIPPYILLPNPLSTLPL